VLGRCVLFGRSYRGIEGHPRPSFLQFCFTISPSPLSRLCLSIVARGQFLHSRPSIHFCAIADGKDGGTPVCLENEGSAGRVGERRHGAVCNHALSGGSYQPLRARARCGRGGGGTRLLRRAQPGESPPARNQYVESHLINIAGRAALSALDLRHPRSSGEGWTRRKSPAGTYAANGY